MAVALLALMQAIESNLFAARSWLTAALNVMSIQWSRIAAISLLAWVMLSVPVPGPEAAIV